MKRIVSCLIGAMVLTSIAGGNVLADTSKPTGSITPDTGATNPYANLNWSYVADSNYIISPYGWRADGFHKGFDIGITDQPVYNSQSGTVLSAGTEASMGNYVSIKTNDTSRTTRTSW